MGQQDEIKMKQKDEENFSPSNKSQFSFKMQVEYIYIVSLKVLRVKKQNKDKIQKGNFIFLQGLNS